MTRALAVLLLLAAPVAADPVKKPAPTTCKRVVVGRGLERKVVCEIAAPIVVKQEAPKPKVLMVHNDGRNVTGRPRSEDRLDGLSHQR